MPTNSAKLYSAFIYSLLKLIYVTLFGEIEEKDNIALRSSYSKTIPQIFSRIRCRICATSFKHSSKRKIDLKRFENSQRQKGLKISSFNFFGKERRKIAILQRNICSVFKIITIQFALTAIESMSQLTPTRKGRKNDKRDVKQYSRVYLGVLGFILLSLFLLFDSFP